MEEVQEPSRIIKSLGMEEWSSNFPSFAFFRLFALCLILVTTIFLRQETLGFETVFDIYLVICLSFLISFAIILKWEDSIKIKLFVPCQMTYDILLTSYLIYLTGINESVFLFMYILNIILAAIIFNLYGALIVAFVAGTIYGLIYYINKDTSATDQFYTLFCNELFFLLTALLSGQIMDEMRKQAWVLARHKEEVSRLKILADRLINHIPSGILQVNKDDFVTAMNNTCLKMFDVEGVPDSEVLYHELFPELEGTRKKWFSLSEEEKIRYTFHHLDKDGMAKVYSLQIVFLSDDDYASSAKVNSLNSEADRTELIFVIHDVSRVQELEQKVSMDSKLAAVGQLAAGIAHEIRTPLASISGSIETLMKNIKTTDQDDKKLVDISLREIRRLDKLITEFMAFVKPSSEEMDGVSLRPLIEEIILGIQSRTNPKIEIKFITNLVSNAIVVGDEEKLKQVFLNLFTNAAESVTAGAVEIRVESSDMGDTIKVMVEDTGPGIPAEAVDKIFDPFFTTKEQGTGLGLSSVAQIVKAHSGSIRVLPIEKGTCFEVSLPKYGADHTDV